MRGKGDVGPSLHATFLVALKDLVAGLTGDPKLSRKYRHRLAGDPQTRVFHPSPNTPLIGLLAPSPKGESVTHVSGTMCYPAPQTRKAKLRKVTRRTERLDFNHSPPNPRLNPSCFGPRTAIQCFGTQAVPLYPSPGLHRLKSEVKLERPAWKCNAVSVGWIP